MNIFNNDRLKRAFKEKISLDEYGKKIAERQQELEHLNEILRGMRSEVASLMGQIKELADQLENSNKGKLLIEKNNEDLDRNYKLLNQSVKDKQEDFLLLDNKLLKIQNDIKKNSSIKEKLIAIKSDYDTIVEQVSNQKEVLAKLNEEKSLSVKNEKLYNEIKSISLKTNKKNKRCTAKTNRGTKCKKFALYGEKFCNVHLMGKNNQR